MRGRNRVAARLNGLYIEPRYGVPPDYYDPGDFDVGYDWGHRRSPTFRWGNGTYMRDMFDRSSPPMNPRYTGAGTPYPNHHEYDGRVAPTRHRYYPGEFSGHAPTGYGGMSYDRRYRQLR